ncbi:hypothetical protein [Aquimarina agarilytica]|uniref:hypothetical protein n=1 Tax=Aquimarina agarilytica TaxID=1087449 RepID=UPI00028A20B1|nr:hypothetical protein [Aquimarina agarilytica]
MKKIYTTAVLLVVFFSMLNCNKKQPIPKKKTPQSERKPTPINTAPIKGLTLLTEATGDLTNDGIPEKINVYDTQKETDFGTERLIHILKKNDTKWVLWKKSIGPILPSAHGGMQGDPFEGISIERNCIVIHHSGGSHQKWSYTHRYRYQNNEWQLIGATTHFGAACDYFETYDYNLSTGNINYRKEIENCETAHTKIEEQQFYKKLKSLPLMDGFYPGNNELKLPNTDLLIFY